MTIIKIDNRLNTCDHTKKTNKDSYNTIKAIEKLDINDHFIIKEQI